MQKFLERMIEERNCLKSKLDKAEKAVANPPYGCNGKSLELLKEQVIHMKAYLDVLNKRIEYEGGEKWNR